MRLRKTIDTRTSATFTSTSSTTSTSTPTSSASSSTSTPTSSTFTSPHVLLLLLLVGVGVGAEAQAHRPPHQPCWSTRSSDKGNQTCMAPAPSLIFSAGNSLFRMNLDGLDQRRIVAKAGTSSVFLDFHVRLQALFWADGKTGIISTAAMNGTHRQKLLVAEKGISGLAVDWIYNALFWSNRRAGCIYKVSLNGKDSVTLLRQLSLPSDIVTDPNERFLFWLSDGVTPSIQRSDQDGQMGTTVLKMVDKLEALSVDRSDQRLFWVQQDAEGQRAVGSCDYNGNVINVFNQPLQSKTLKMAVFLDFVYISESTSQLIVRLDKYSGGAMETVHHNRLPHPPGEITVVHPLQQPMVERKETSASGCNDSSTECVKVCSGSWAKGTPCQCKDGFTLSKHGNVCEDINECALWNHGCSLGCENIPGSYFCSCPHGYVLLPDLKTCHELKPCVQNASLCQDTCVHTDNGDVCVCTEGSVLLPDGLSCSGCSAADRGGCSQVCVPLGLGRWECECAPGYTLRPDGKRCLATGPPPYLVFANLLDIQHLKTDGTEGGKVLLDPNGEITAIDHDPVTNQVFFSSKGQIERAGVDGGGRQVLMSTGLDSPEGLALDWINRQLYWTDRGLSKISRCNLQGQQVQAVIDKEIHQPRGLAIHPQAQKLFWTEMGNRPCVSSSGLDGGGRVVIAHEGLVTPSGLALDLHAQLLYWCDMQRGAIEVANMDGSHRVTLTQTQVGRPFALTVFEDWLWVSDWEKNRLVRVQTASRSIHTHTPLTPQGVGGRFARPAGLVIVHPLAKPGANMCLHKNGGCTQLCESRLGLALCSCQSGFIQSSDGKDCVLSRKSRPRPGSGDGEVSSVPPKPALNDEGFPPHTPQEPEPTLITEKMVADQDECFSQACDVNAQCVLDEGHITCHCLPGFTGNGELCLDIDECAAGLSECVNPLSECVNTIGGHYCRCKPGFSGDGHHCTDVDECSQRLHECHEKAECVNAPGRYTCICKTGFTGTGFTCKELKIAPSWLTTVSPVTVTTVAKRELCGDSHDSYCMYDGVCFYFPEMESYACNCVSGYMGERCQYSDLEWWELQQAEEEKKRRWTTAIAVVMAILVSILTLSASLTYCYGTRRMRRREHPSVDNMSESSTCEDSITESNTPRLYLVVDHDVCVDKKVLHLVSCQSSPTCNSCHGDAGEAVVSTDPGVGLEAPLECPLVDGCSKPPEDLIILDEPQETSISLL